MSDARPATWDPGGRRTRSPAVIVHLRLPKMSFRLALHLLHLVLTLSLGACNRSESEPRPSPPPPSEKVPDAPGPDNRVREMPQKPTEPPKTSRRPGDYGGIGHAVGMDAR